MRLFVVTNRITAQKVSEFRFFSGLYFTAFRLNTKTCWLNLRIQFGCGKKRTKRTPNSDAFLVVNKEITSPCFNALHLLEAILEYSVKQWGKVEQVQHFHFNPYHARSLFLYFLKTLESQRFDDVFMGSVYFYHVTYAF